MDTSKREHLEALCRLIRYWVLKSTSSAGSGHPTSALSAVELMADLFFTGLFRYRPDEPDFANNDRLIFSKGHASPLLYALWAAADMIPEQQLETYRQFDSNLEGHPTDRFRYTEAATGSLGQGLSIGLGMALGAKRLDQLPYRTYVLLGDSEMAEGSQWEAIQLAAHYQLDNLIGILDVNRLGQRGATMYGHDLSAYERRVAAFGWDVRTIEDGHDHDQILAAYREVEATRDRPLMLVARTIKGKGVKQLEDAGGWHGKALGEEDLTQALEGIGAVDRDVRGTIAAPKDVAPRQWPCTDTVEEPSYELGSAVATRDGYGNGLKRIAGRFPAIVALDGEVSNSTRAEYFGEAYPDRFFEMYIAEQNMVGAATGLALRGKIPFASTFAAFLSRAFDQIRMCPYSGAGVKFVGSHAGVSIGEDGPSQMGLEDIAMFRTLRDAVIFYPADAVSTERMVELMAEHAGICYLRTTRGKTPVIYTATDKFSIGGSHPIRRSDQDDVTLIGAGITVHEAIAAADKLADEGITARVIDLYCIQPIDDEALARAARETDLLVVVEDHGAAGGIGEAVRASLAESPTRIVSLAVTKRPRSGEPDELLGLESISAEAIARTVLNMRQHAS